MKSPSTHITKHPHVQRQALVSSPASPWYRGSHLLNKLKAWFRTRPNWSRTWREDNPSSLGDLSDHLLHDIGFSRNQVLRLRGRLDFEPEGIRNEYTSLGMR